MRTYRLTFTLNGQESVEEHTELDALMSTIAQCAKGVHIKVEHLEARTLFEATTTHDGADAS